PTTPLLFALSVSLPLLLLACSQPDKPRSDLQVTAQRVTGEDGSSALEFKVAAPQKFQARAVDPRLVVSGRTIERYRYADRDKSLVFTEPDPKSLAATEEVTLEWGEPGDPAVESQQVPYHFDP